MTGDQPEKEMDTTPKKRAGDPLSHPGSPQRSRIMSLPDQSSSPPMINSFSGSSNLFLSSTPGNPPTSPSFNTLPVRASAPLEESEDVKICE